jgi:serine/threonine-protein kinase HipA
MSEGPLRQRLALTRVHESDKDDFGILAAAGKDMPGAVRVVPADLGRLTPYALRRGAQLITAGTDAFDLAVPQQAEEGASLLAGVQDKLGLFWAGEGQPYQAPSNGLLSNIIAKLPHAGDDEQIRNEYAGMALAGLAGVNVATCRCVSNAEISGSSNLAQSVVPGYCFLAVDRFDRKGGQPVHMEDACQLLTLMPGKKYSGIDKFIKFIRILDRFGTKGSEDVQQFFIRQTVNTLLGNSDAHLKNFSVLYPDEEGLELSPAYDILCVAALPGFRGLRTNVAVDKLQWQETLRTYIDIAIQAGVAERIASAAVTQTVDLACDRWPEALREMDVSDSMRETILERLRSLPLVSSSQSLG